MKLIYHHSEGIIDLVVLYLHLHIKDIISMELELKRMSISDDHC